MMTEDWSTGVLDWPDCVGFNKAPVDHYLRPFWLRIGLEGTQEFIDKWIQLQMYIQTCKWGYNYDLDHVFQFDNAYLNKPKFAISWLTQLTHEDNTWLFDTDHEFAEFFETLNEKSKNSFIFFQADHGSRRGPVRNVPVIGPIEENNPFLYVIVPEKLRKNPTFMKQLKENSKQLVSQLDLHASAVQVAKFSHQWTDKTDFNQPMNSISGREFLGSSIFHQMKQPKTCKNLHIPWYFCICGAQTIQLKDPALAKRVAQTIVDFINEQLDKSKYKNDCLRHELSPKYSIQLEETVQKENENRVLKVKFETLPGHSLYQGAVHLKQDNSILLLQTEFARLNTYKHQAYCIQESFFRNYCVCKN